MYEDPKMAQLQRDIQQYNNKTQEITFRDSTSMNEFIKLVKRKIYGNKY